jgi:glycosyltransferase involved in cell wall biosynthesis
MIRIVHLITGLNVGGAERTLAQMVRASDARRFLHSVISMIHAGPVANDLARAGIEVRSLGMSRGEPSLGGAVRLVSILRHLRPHLLHCWMYHANLLGILAGEVAGVPRIIWGIRCSNRDFASGRALTRWVVALGAFFSPIADVITVNSESGKQVHENWGYSGSRMMVIRNGVDLDLFRPDEAARGSVRAELGLSRDALLVGLIARFDPMKDHTTFFQAAALLCRREPRAHFLLCGNEVAPENPALARMASEQHLLGHVHLLGLRQDVARLTAALDVATSCSAFGEGFCNAVGEAMACGVPCVVTGVGDSADIVGDTGHVIPTKNPEALAAAWAEILNLTPAARSELASRARQRIKKRFAAQRAVEAYESLYEQLSTHTAAMPRTAT